MLSTGAIVFDFWQQRDHLKRQSIKMLGAGAIVLDLENNGSIVNDSRLRCSEQVPLS